MPRRWTPHSKWPSKQLRPSIPGVFPGDVEDGQGSSIQIVPSWDGYRLARASRYYYRNLAQDVPVVVIEESTWQGFIPRLPFKGLGRSQFRFSQTLDDSIVIPEADTTPVWLARPRFLPFGRSQFRFQQPQDFDTPIDFEHQGFIARLQYLPLGRSQFRFFATYDDSVIVAPEDWTANFTARAKWSGLRTNPYQFSLARDLDIVTPSFENIPAFFVRSMSQPFDGRRAATRLHNFSVLDESTAAPVIPGEVMVVIKNTPGAIEVRVLIEHPTTTRVVVDSPNKIVVVQDDPAAIPLKVVI